jgi:hypothetical protein
MDKKSRLFFKGLIRGGSGIKPPASRLMVY